MTEPLKLQLDTEQETARLAQALAQANITGLVFLIGELGVGKTTLTRYWLQALGHQGAVKSPTYTLVEPYLIAQRNVCHFDLYRLHDPYELELMGIREYLQQSDSLSIVEWPSKGEGVLPSPQMIIAITVQDQQRTAILTAADRLLTKVKAGWDAH